MSKESGLGALIAGGILSLTALINVNDIDPNSETLKYAQKMTYINEQQYRNIKKERTKDIYDALQTHDPFEVPITAMTLGINIMSIGAVRLLRAYAQIDEEKKG